MVKILREADRRPPDFTSTREQSFPGRAPEVVSVPHNPNSKAVAFSTRTCSSISLKTLRLAFRSPLTRRGFGWRCMMLDATRIGRKT
jgi:hypothetical protein